MKISKVHQDQLVTFDDFLKKIKSEQNRLNGYRKDTASISLRVATKTGSVHPFYEQKSSERMVRRFGPEMDLHRKNDVAKFLRVVANNLLFNATLSDEMKEYVNHKRKNTKVTFKKVKI